MYGTLLTDNRGKPTHNSLPAMERMHTSTMDAPDSIGRKEDSDKFEIEIDQWSKLVKSYKRNKEVLEKTILDQLAALKRLDEDYESANANLYHKIEITYNQLKSGVHHQQPSTTEDRIRDMRKCQEEKIKLNVGGQIYETSLSTLRKDPNSWLASIFSDTSQLLADSNHSYFIDRDGTHFRIILNYLRDLKIPPSVTENPRVMDELMQEARYYQLNGLLKLKWDKLPSISQDELHRLYPLPKNTHNYYEPVIMDLQQKDLSNLDFSYYQIDPRSTFMNSNLENANFENARFVFDFDYQVNFQSTYLIGATFPKYGTINRASGIEMELEGAVFNRPLNES